MKKINIAGLLKDCPKGMKLDCTMFENVTFEGLIDKGSYKICIKLPTTEEYYLTEYGCWNTMDSAKCVIFPKGKTTWEGFVPPCNFKDGDILYCNANDDGENKDMFKYIFIFDKIVDGRLYYSHCHLFGSDFYDTKTNLVDDYPIRFATEEEKQKLFQAIKDNGYKWNVETKTLEKLIEPKFKVGDRIKNGEKNAIIVRICKDSYDVKYDSGIGSFTIDLQDEWELVPGKFDISTLIPFESRVLIRDQESQKWCPAIWGTYEPEQYYPYRLIGTISHCCIPYEGNEHLLNTTNDCDEFYKTWE